MYTFELRSKEGDFWVSSQRLGVSASLCVCQYLFPSYSPLDGSNETITLCVCEYLLSLLTDLTQPLSDFGFDF